MSGLMAPWPVRVAKALDRDENSRVIVENLDQIIRWITGRPSDSTTALDLEIEKLGLEPAMARTRALVIINRMMLSRQDPWQALGVRRGTDLGEVRVRYKRLMQVFHPDRGFADSDWLSDCTARLHWAHDAIRKSPTGRSGFSAGFGKRQRRPSPPPWTRRSADPVFHKPEVSAERESDKVAVPSPSAQSASADSVDSGPAESAQPAGIASGVWQFPTPGKAANTPHQQDEEYVQQQARRTTESVATPQSSGFASTHDVMAEDLQSADQDDEPDYDSVFEQALHAEDLRGEGSPQSEDASIDAPETQSDSPEGEAVVDIFEQASPSANELLRPSADMRKAKSSAASARNERDTRGANPGHSEHEEIVLSEAPGPFESGPTDASRAQDESDALDRMVEERLERSKSAQSARDAARAAQARAREEEERNKRLAEQEIARLRQEAKEKSAQMRLAKQEEYRKEKERRRLLRREQKLERARAKDQQKQEKLSRKQRELQQQRLDAEATEKRLKEERQRKRARAKERAEAESEKRRLRELNDLHQQEVEAISAQRAREAERRRRHLEAEGNRLSSISERTYGDVESLTETTIPPWHEQTRERSVDVAHARGSHDTSGMSAESPGISARSAPHAVDPIEDGVRQSRRASGSNVAPIRPVSAKAREQHREPRSSRSRSQAKVESIEHPGSIRPRRQYRDAPIAEPQTHQAANDDTVPVTRGLIRSPRLAMIGAGMVGLLAVSVIVGKLFFGAADEGASVSQSNQQSNSVASDDTGSGAQSVVGAQDSEPTSVVDASSTSARGQSTSDTPGSSAQSPSALVTESVTAVDKPAQADTVVTEAEPVVVSDSEAVQETTNTGSSEAVGPRTVQSIVEPAIDRNPTTVAAIPGADSGASNTGTRSSADAAAAIPGERGVNVSTDPLTNVRHLADEFSRRFIDGDAEAFASLFSIEATMNDFKGAPSIQDAHSELFGSTSRRHVSIDLGDISGSGNYYNTRGRLSQVLRFSDGTSKLSDSNFDMTVERTGDNFVIRTLSF